MVWKGGMKFSRKRIGKIRVVKISRREKYRLLIAKLDAEGELVGKDKGYNKYLNDYPDLLNKAITFCIGKLKLGYKLDEAQPELLTLIKKMRKDGYCQKKIDSMVRKSVNKYRFGFETPRMIGHIKGLLKHDLW
jgi:hypothetical protein